MNWILRRCVLCLVAGLLTALCSAQLVKEDWANSTGFNAVEASQVVAIPGGDFLVSVGGQLARVKEKGGFTWTISMPSQTTIGDFKLLPDGNVYVVAYGAESYIGKFSMADGSKVGEFADPGTSTAARLGPDLTSYFTQIFRVSSTDFRIFQVGVLRVSNTLITTVYQFDAPAGKSYDTVWSRILFYKGQTIAFITGANAEGINGLEAWSLDSTGIPTWEVETSFDLSSFTSGQAIPRYIGFDIAGNPSVVYLDSVGTEHGYALAAATGAPTTYASSAVLADNEFATGGFIYRSYNEGPLHYQEEYNVNTTPKMMLMKRNAADTSSVWTIHGTAICRIPFQILDLNPNTLSSTGAFTIAADRDTDLQEVDTATVSGPKRIEGVAQQQDTGNVLVVGTDATATSGYKPIYFAHFISQPVLNSYTYAVPKNHAFTSPNSIFFADRFTGGLSPQIGAYVKHGTLILHTDGTFVYTPTTGFTGTDFFIYRVQRPGLPTVSAEIGLSVS